VCRHVGGYSTLAGAPPLLLRLTEEHSPKAPGRRLLELVYSGSGPSFAESPRIADRANAAPLAGIIDPSKRPMDSAVAMAAERHGAGNDAVALLQVVHSASGPSFVESPRINN
jgi:hypothetical protein